MLKVASPIAVLIFLASLLVASTQATGHNGKIEEPKDRRAEGAQLVLGGLLYDNWAKIKGVETQGNHPLYPPDAKKSGASTWRCKECHGWDYIGSEGRYSKGSHYTGIKGIYGATGDQIAVALSGKTLPGHDFSGFLTSDDIAALAAFINNGLVEWNSELLKEVTTPGSDEGKALYAKGCADCHGDDGTGMDFKAKKDGVQGVGWLARDNPQETLHKIRWGHPTSSMPSTVVDDGLTLEQEIELMRYAVTLP